MRPEGIVEAWDRADPALEPEEKETTIRWAKPDNEAVIHTDEAAVGRRLVAHEHSTVEEVTVLADGTRQRKEAEDVYDGDEPVSVRCRLPVAALSVSSSPRSSPHHANVVSQRVLADGGRVLTDGGDGSSDADEWRSEPPETIYKRNEFRWVANTLDRFVDFLQRYLPSFALTPWFVLGWGIIAAVLYGFRAQITFGHPLVSSALMLVILLVLGRWID
jgi:hypothetical protein